MSIDISIIIPTYNRPTNLKRAIESVISQTYENWELIVVDDNNPKTQSRIETENILRYYCKIDSRIRYVKHERNRNGAAARNTGVRLARGEYVAFLDDDDEYLPEKLKIQYNALQNKDNNIYGGAYSGFLVIRNKKLIKSFNKINSGRFIKDTLACTFNMGSGSNLFIRKDIIIKLNGFDETFYRHQDYEFLVRFFENYQLLGINTPLFKVEQSSSHLNLPNAENAYKYRKKYIDKYKNILNHMNQIDSNEVYHKNFISLGQLAIKEKKYKFANLLIKEAVKHKKNTLGESLRILILFIYSILPGQIKNKIGKVRM